ncbi:unnamed protein product [Closterium sp. NIES-54]
MHVNKTLHCKILALNAFYTVKMHTGESMHEYATRVEELGETFMDLGGTITEEDWILTLLCGLPEEWSMVIATLDSVQDTWTKEMVVGRLLHEESRCRQFTNESEGAAMFSGGSSGKKSTWSKGATKKSSGGSDRGKGNTSNGSSKCHYCGKAGHFWHECRKRPSNWTPSKARNHKGNAHTASGDADDSRESIVLLANDGTNTPSDAWFLNTGATQHMTHSASFLTNVGAPGEVTSVVFRNDKSLPVVGVGSTRLIVDGGPVDITNPGASGVNPRKTQGIAESEGASSGGAEPKGEEPGGAEPVGVEPGGAESECAESEGAEPKGAASSGGPAGASPRLSPQQLLTAGAGGTGGTAATGPGGARTRGTGATGTGGVGGAGDGDPTEPGSAGVGGSGAGGAGAGGARAGGTGAGGAGAGGDGVGGTGAGGAGAGGTDAGGVGAGGTGAGGAGAGGAGAVDLGGTMRPRPYFVPLLQQVLRVTSSTSLTPPLLCPPPDQSQLPLQPASPLPAPSPYTEQFGGLTERREPASHPVLPIRTARRVPRSRPPHVPSTHAMALRPSSVPLCVPLPAPPESSLSAVSDPESDRARATSPTVSRLLATAVTDPSFQSGVASALIVELLDFATACRLDDATALVVESASASPPSIGGECALGTDVLEDM